MKLSKLLKLVILESAASDEAHALGLRYKGHGYWTDESGETVAQTVKGKLVKYDPSSDPANEKSVYMSHTAKQTPQALHGVPFQSWADAPSPPQKTRPKYDPRAEAAETVKWQGISGTNPNLQEPPMESGHMKKGAGVIIMEPDGRVWVVEPSNHYAGYEHTFPKGTLEKGLTMQETAVKEAYEESGLQVQISDLIGDFVRTGSVSRYYLAKRVGGTPSDHGWETNSVKLVPLDQLSDYLNTEGDAQILAALQEKLANPQGYQPKMADIEKIKQMKKDDDEWKAKQQSLFKSSDFDPTQNDFWSNFTKKQSAKDDVPKKKQPSNASFPIPSPADLAAQKKATPKKVAPTNPPVTASEPMKQEIMAQKVDIGIASGMNEGGTYKGVDGKVRYVKFYNKDRSIASCENLTNTLYRELGLQAPVSVTFEGNNGQRWFASEILPGVEGDLVKKLDKNTGTIPKEYADQILDGFVADCFFANWDVVGVNEGFMRNVVTMKDGTVARIDQGGSLLFGGLGGRKNPTHLMKLGEWDIFPSVNNPSYHIVFKSAGLKSADQLGERAVKQIDNLLALGKKYGGWEKFIEANSPEMKPEDKKQIAQVLNAREQILVQKRAQLASNSNVGPSKLNHMASNSR